MTIKRLDWDSEFFGYEVGKLELDIIENFNLESFYQESKKFKLVYVFSIDFLDFKGFNLVDKKVTLYQEINTKVIANNNMIESFDIKIHNYQQLKELAIESGMYSRFNIDKNFKNNEFLKLYNRWIENSVNNIAAFDVIVALNDNNIVGFITLNKKNEKLSDIGLLAVAKESRGLGIGKGIINESIIRSKNAGFKGIQVVTQLDNLAALSLYRSANFEIKEITNIYHFWNL
jgi:dTDP-4-amino-4,6-dideoxy-D-galactose acyltransferase